MGDGECEGECQFDAEQPGEIDGVARGVGCVGGSIMVWRYCMVYVKRAAFRSGATEEFEVVGRVFRWDVDGELVPNS